MDVVSHINETLFMIKFILPPILLLCLNSCINMNDPKYQAEYIRVRKTYNEYLTNHIPAKIPNNVYGYHFSSNWKKGYSYFILRTKEKSKKYYSIKNRYINSNSTKKLSNDTILIKVTQQEFNTDSLGLKYAGTHYLIVPKELYEGINQDYQTMPIDYNFDIVILDCKYSSLISKMDYNNLNTNDGILAKNYSKGIAFYDKDLVITYWVITW